MKRLFTMIIGAAVVTAACGTGPAGSLGPAPADTARPSGSILPSGGPTNAAPSQGGQRPATPAAAPGREIGLQVWFTRHGKIFVTQRAVPATTAVGRATLDRLLAGPSAAEHAAGLRSGIPADTTLLGLRITGGIATVDLSSSFESAAGVAAMPLRIAQVGYTLTQFPTVTGIRFQINGQGATVIGGVPVQGPQTRAMYQGYLPAITVQSPVIGARVTSPVIVSGTADVFEAVVSVRILGPGGNEIARTFTSASCGTGCRGGYSVTVPYSVAQAEPGTIEVFENSARNALPVNAQLIPVTLAP